MTLSELKEIVEAGQPMRSASQAPWAATLLQALRALLWRAATEGMGGRQFGKESSQLLTQLGHTPFSDEVARLVWANSVGTLSSATQWARTAGNPEAHRLFPYLRWQSVGDCETQDRPGHNHKAMGGYVASIGHPIWSTWWPIAGDESSCYIEAITGGQARRAGWAGDEPLGPWPIDPWTDSKVQPDLGFVGVPRSQRLVKDDEHCLFDLTLLARALGLGGSK